MQEQTQKAASIMEQGEAGCFGTENVICSEHETQAGSGIHIPEKNFHFDNFPKPERAERLISLDSSSDPSSTMDPEDLAELTASLSDLKDAREKIEKTIADVSDFNLLSQVKERLEVVVNSPSSSTKTISEAKMKLKQIDQIDSMDPLKNKALVRRFLSPKESQNQVRKILLNQSTKKLKADKTLTYAPPIALLNTIEMCPHQNKKQVETFIYAVLQFISDRSLKQWGFFISKVINRIYFISAHKKYDEKFIKEICKISEQYYGVEEDWDYEYKPFIF